MNAHVMILGSTIWRTLFKQAAAHDQMIEEFGVCYQILKQLCSCRWVTELYLLGSDFTRQHFCPGKVVEDLEADILKRMHVMKLLPFSLELLNSVCTISWE